MSDTPLNVEIDPVTAKALGLDGGVQPAQQRPLDPAIIDASAAHVLYTVFGPSMKPRFKSQLLTFVSFNAIHTIWAADHFQHVYKDRQHGNM